MTLHVGQRGPAHQSRVGWASAVGGSTPDPFALGDVAAAVLGGTYESATVAVTGIDAPAALTVSGGEYAINGGGWASAPASASNGDTVKVRGAAPGSVSSATDVVLDIGGATDTFSITTVANSEASALIARFTADPGTARRALVDGLVGDLKAAGVWSKLDALWVLAAHDEQAARLNWLSASYGLTKVNAPTFAVDLGYTGDGSSAYLDTGFNDLTGTAQYLQDSFHLGCYCNLNNGGGNSHIGTTSAVTTRINASTTQLATRVHSATSFNTSTNAAVGHNVITRDGSTSSRALHNGASVGASSAASTAPTSANLAIFRSASSYNADRIAAAHLGAFLTPTEVSNLYGALLTYLAALGAS